MGYRANNFESVKIMLDISSERSLLHVRIIIIFLKKKNQNYDVNMGQISSPLSMRLSKSMHWPFLWNDQINFTKKYKADVLTTTLLPLFFNESIYMNNYTNNHQLSFYLNTIFLKRLSINKDYYEFLFFKKKLAFNSLESLTPFFLSFFGKLWLVKFNSWFILIFFVFSPKKAKLLSKITNNKFNKWNYLVWKLNTQFLMKKSLVTNSNFFLF